MWRGCWFNRQVLVLAGSPIFSGGKKQKVYSGTKGQFLPCFPNFQWRLGKLLGIYII